MRRADILKGLQTRLAKRTECFQLEAGVPFNPQDGYNQIEGQSAKVAYLFGQILAVRMVLQDFESIQPFSMETYQRHLWQKGTFWYTGFRDATHNRDLEAGYRYEISDMNDFAKAGGLWGA